MLPFGQDFLEVEVPPRKSCSAGVKNEIPSRKQSSRSPENHDDLKTNKLRSTIPLMDLLPPSLDPLLNHT